MWHKSLGLEANGCDAREEEQQKNRGIKVGWLKKLLQAKFDTGLEEGSSFKDRNFYWLMESDDGILDITAEQGCSLWALAPSSARGVPTVFISHTWTHKLSNFIKQLEGMPSDDALVWIDVVAVNQHKLFVGSPGNWRNVAQKLDASVVQAMKDTVTSASRVVFMLDTDGKALGRIWCLFELWQAVGFGGGSEKLHMMTDDAGLLHMRAAYAAVCSRKADARCQQDRLNFLDLIAADIGCEKLDQLIRDAIFQSTEREVAQADKPLAKASALLKSSLLLMTRGDGAKSEAQAKEAYQLRAKQLGEAHRDTCNALLLWASSTFVLHMMNRKDVGPVDRAMELLAKGRKTMEGLGATSGKADQILVSFIGMHGQCLEAKAGHLNSNFPETKELWEQWFKLKEAAVQDYVAAVGLLAKVELNDTYHEGMREMDKAVMLANMGWCCFDMWSIKVQQSGYKTVEGDAKLLSSALTATGKAYGFARKILNTPYGFHTNMVAVFVKRANILAMLNETWRSEGIRRTALRQASQVLDADSVHLKPLADADYSKMVKPKLADVALGLLGPSMFALGMEGVSEADCQCSPCSIM